MDKEYEIIKQKIDEAKNIWIFGHNNIDGDCIASCLGLGKILEKLGKKVNYYTAQEPEKALQFIKWVNKFKTELKWDINDLIIFMDTGNPDKLNDIYVNNPEYFKDKYIINIDHHLSNTNFGNINVIRTDLSSNAEHVFLIIENFWKDLIDADIATTLLTGVITDTGNFFHQNTTSETFENASRLVWYWADRETIIEKVFRSNELNSLDITKHILENVKIHKNTIYSYIDLDEIERLWIDYRSKEVWYSILSNIKWFKNYVMLIKMWNIIKWSIKNKDWLSNKIAEKLWGWGHSWRSWFKIQIQKSLEDEIEAIIKTTAEYKN